MDKSLKQFLARAKQLALPQRERDALHDFFIDAVGYGPGKKFLRNSSALILDIKEKAAVRAALMDFISQHTLRKRPRRLGWRLPSLQPVRLRFSAIMTVLLLCSMSTVFAAEAAIPGDILYPVKRSVTEPVLTTLHFTPMARAEWSVELLNRRLDEAEQVLVDRPAKSVEVEREILTQSEHLKNNLAILKAEHAVRIRVEEKLELETRLTRPQQVRNPAMIRYHRILRDTLHDIGGSTTTRSTPRTDVVDSRADTRVHLEGSILSRAQSSLATQSSSADPFLLPADASPKTRQRLRALVKAWRRQ